ncbi:MAG: type II toxin-antitoxin system HipA family toxin [Acholeplasma sp.]|nr:type II toxin-antitoxin system HipA family toxin [Acholeplasma sp.]
MNLDIKRLVVKHNSKVVGYLQDIGNERIAFQYDERWVKEGFSISPFSLPLSNEVYVSKSNFFKGLFGVFYDSLPDGWGELLLRRTLAKKGISFERLTVLSRLSLINNIGLGSLTYEPSQEDISNNAFAELDYLANEVKNILIGSPTTDLDIMYRLGGSSGGARPKAHLIINNEAWIVKFPTIHDPKDIGEREFEANELARESGIAVNHSALMVSNSGKQYFAARRFDRFGDKRVHMISLSAILETTHQIPNLDYVHLFQVIQKICVDQSDLYEAYRRMCFNVLYGNRDDHGKNFAFVYDEKLRGYRLSLAYDITRTNDKYEHEMTVLGDGVPSEDKLLEFAKQMDLSIKKCEEIISKIKSVI